MIAIRRLYAYLTRPRCYTCGKTLVPCEYASEVCSDECGEESGWKQAGL